MKLFRLFVLSLFCFSAVGQLPSQDILALLEFKKSIKYDPTGYVLESWNAESIDFNGCPASWNGIVCNGGNVAGVVLNNLGLSADVDVGVFTNLTKLVKLSMSNNSISGKIPENVGNFRRLEFLDLSDNLFSSVIPVGIGRLQSLRNLSLVGNKFSGSIPDTILELASVESLDFSCNSFSGPLPASWTRLNSLLYLNLSVNGFTKNIPRGFELLLGLQVLDLHGNMFDGNLDGDFFLLTNASHIDLSSNMLASSSSQMILPGLSDSVKVLNLSHNHLAGSLIGGGDLGLFANLIVLDLSYNLSGELPGFNFAYELEVLRLSSNRFSGFIPNDLLKGDSLPLTELDLSANNLSGPVSMVMSTTLCLLNLSSNALMDGLPLLTGSCAVLDLSNNQFKGNITKISKWENIEYLDLSQNHLTGPIPEVTFQLLRLNYLNLSHNSLNSFLPKVITRSSKLRVLDLSSNQIAGPLLTDFNLLQGSIEFSPPSSNKSNLQILDLSHNQLSSYFPDEFGSLPGLQMLNLEGNNISGSLPTSMADMSSITFLDLSQNHFTGPLPFNLSNTLTNFNVSYNDLSGIVPENLRSRLSLLSGPAGDSNSPAEKPRRKPINTVVKVVIIVSCVIAAFDLVASRKGSSSEVISPDKKMAAVSGFSPSKHSHLSWSPESQDSFAAETLAKLEVGSPDQLVGELHFLDDTITLTPEELSRAPAVVLGRSSHGTSYRATLDNGIFMTKKEFSKEAKKFANIRHPNVVALRGYYWGPTQHENLILSDYISPGSLASFLYDRPGRKGPPLTWPQRLKIAVDIARGLNYLHFDRAVPHGNIKTTNVLLHGPELNARVADYCLHRLMTQASTIEQILDAGVLGYRAPELVASKKPLPSFKSDVYAFGVLLLELITGRCAGDVVSVQHGRVDLTDWVRLRVTEGCASECFEPALKPEMGTPVVEKGMKDVFGIALKCVRSVSERPGTKTIYEDLSSI
ncbi:hypothetical protein K2173_000497 [Erythroxylum novogranatense]|uniref:Protein kinase domain-containing protein n=1 Tax=Erythroxylum novogranatense TaxID=1862640 RepID=A0AAV8SXB6_9ROSI|nr:hypothetical protein K2173_000497 [Erythroxylum novogranatense]